jgi:hypothetical protein
MFKNEAGQKLVLFAFARATGVPVLLDAANITCRLSLDYGTRVDTTTVNPTEDEDGIYKLPLTQAETNADSIVPYPESATPGVQVVVLYHSSQTVVRGTVTPSASGVRGGWFGAGWFGGGVGVALSNGVFGEGARSGEIAYDLFIGDDYLASNGRSLTWTVPIPPGTTVDGSTCRLTFKQVSGSCEPFSIAFTGNVSVSSTEADLDFDMTSVLTATIVEAEYSFFVEWLGDSGEKITKIYNRQIVDWKGKS